MKFLDSHLKKEGDTKKRKTCSIIYQIKITFVLKQRSLVYNQKKKNYY